MLNEIENKSIQIPTLNDLVRIEKKVVSSVDWNKDLEMYELLSHGGDIKLLKTVEQCRSRLYGLLKLKQVLFPYSSKTRAGNIAVYNFYNFENESDRSKVVVTDAYRIGPVQGGHIYHFGRNYKAIAESWVEAYNKRNTVRKAFVLVLEKAL
ncbi:MAG: hypothetical protein Q7S27_01155 [Nanoarchaeota archaeon]|nr:hypothetical protein [Nanoarchaeota archaeon]